MPSQLLDITSRSAGIGILALLLAGATAAHADAAAPADSPAVTGATTSAAVLDDSLPAVLRAMQMQDYARALKLLTAAGAQQTTAPDLQLLLGICYARVGQLAQAEPLLLQAAAHGDAEEQASARVFLGLLYESQGAADRAQAELTMAAQLRSPRLQSGIQSLLQEVQPHMVTGSVTIAPELDMNVPLTSLALWRNDPQSRTDGDILFSGTITIRPSKRFGFYFTNTLSYRQQLRFSEYSLLLNWTGLGYNYLGQRNRVRVSIAAAPAVVATHLLYFDFSWRASYRFNPISVLNLGVAYDGRYRNYVQADYLAQTGPSHTLVADVGYASPALVGGKSLVVFAGFAVTRDQLSARAPITAVDGSLVSDDWRAWSYGPQLRLRARLHQRVELAITSSLLRRDYDYIFPSGEQRQDWELSGDAAMVFELKRWLDLFVGGSCIYLQSSDAAFSYVKPVIYTGITGHFAAK